MRIRKMALWAALGSLLMLWAPAAASAAPAVTLDVAVGWNDAYVVGRITPVVVKVTNSGPEIHGALELHTGGSSGILVRREVVLPQGSTKVFQLPCRMDGIARNAEDFRVNLVASGATVAYGQPAVVPQALDPTMLVGGLLSDDPSGLAYCQGITLSQFSAGSRWVNLDAAMIGEDPRLLDSFQVILVNNYDPAQLSDAQRSALRSWIWSGGAMLIGGGPGREAQIQAWGDLTEGLVFNGSFETSETPSTNYMGGEDTSLSGKLAVSRMEGRDWAVGGIWEKESLPSMLSRSYGAGMFNVLSYDLAGTFGRWKYAQSALSSMLGSMSLNNPMAYNYTDMDYMVRSALQGQITGERWLFTGYLVVLVLFVPASGLLCYRLLRRRGRQKLMWLVVPAVSVVFSAAVLAVGNVSLGRTPEAYCFTATTVNNGGEQQVRNVLIHAPVMGDYTLKAGKGLMMPLSDTLAYQNYNAYGSNPINNAPATAIVQVDDPQVRFTHVNLNATRMAVLRDATTDPSVQMDFHYDGLVVQCKVKNSGQWPIRDAFVVHGGQYTILGTLNPGEERSFQVPLGSGDNNGAFYSATEQLYPNAYSGHIDESQMRFQILQAYSNVMNAQSQYNPNQALGRAYFFGFSDRPWQGDLTINGRAVQPKSAELLMSNAQVRRDENAPTALVTPTLQEPTDGSVSIDSSRLYLRSGQQATLAYHADLNAGVQWKKLVLQYNSFDPDGKNMQIVRWSIYNCVSKKWMDLDANGTQLVAEGDHLDWYLSTDGTLQLRAMGMQDVPPTAPSLVLTGVKQ